MVAFSFFSPIKKNFERSEMMDWNMIYKSKLECWDNSTQARKTQSKTLQNTEDCHMQYSVKRFANYGMKRLINGVKIKQSSAS
jgi:hypothetical protein